jgi:Domain of unknown function (DUF4386)
MPENIQREAQTSIARLAGAMYLVTMATALFAEGYVRGTLLVSESAAQTAQNIVRSNQLFRVGIAADLITFVGVVVLVWSLYQLLKPVDARLAVLGAFFRLVELAVHFSATTFSLVAVSFLGGGEYTGAFDARQLQGLAGFALRAQGTGLMIGFIPLGLGSAVFAWLLLRSGLVPRLLAGWGILASLALAVYAMALVVSPATSDFFYFAMIPMFIYEVSVGLWLLLKGTAGRPVTAN